MHECGMSQVTICFCESFVLQTIMQINVRVYDVLNARALLFSANEKEEINIMNKTESENSILLIADGCKKQAVQHNKTKQNDHIQLFVSVGHVCVNLSIYVWIDYAM